ncbi:protein NATD1 isoform X1 [Macaca nemestrina]|uniref:protein NATD1 isoform X1 n=1 Tax=Macaca nemestrina TaxID=9545 RepID=UPI0005F3DD8B|nr:protein NATD1 isoform X1 [Macaca nemestrina]
MAHSAAAVPLGALEQSCPIRVEHDRRRRQFTVRLNGAQHRERGSCISRIQMGRLRHGEVKRLAPSLAPQRWRSCDSPRCHDRAVLLYEYVGKRIVDLQHTEVPDAYRGRGIAKHLAKAALDFVVEEDLKAHLTCWYIQKYVKENPLPQYLERLQP